MGETASPRHPFERHCPENLRPPLTSHQIFEPIREDLEAVEARVRPPHPVAGGAHPRDGALHPEERRQARAAGGPADGRAAERLHRRPRRAQRRRWWSSSTPRRWCTTTSSTRPDLRRGRLAVHSRWGNDITVLLGDYLYIKSMAMALTQDSLDVIRLLCDVTLRMIEGELYQLTKTGDVDITEDEHFEIIRRKTAFLFGGCAQIGGMLGGVSPGTRDRAARVRLQSRHRVPAGRRPARLHRRCRRARQADRRRPARRQGDAADHLPPAPRRRGRRQPDPRHRPRPGGDDRAVARDPAPDARASRHRTRLSRARSSTPGRAKDSLLRVSSRPRA